MAGGGVIIGFWTYIIFNQCRSRGTKNNKQIVPLCYYDVFDILLYIIYHNRNCTWLLPWFNGNMRVQMCNNNNNNIGTLFIWLHWKEHKRYKYTTVQNTHTHTHTMKTPQTTTIDSIICRRHYHCLYMVAIPFIIPVLTAPLCRPIIIIVVDIR